MKKTFFPFQALANLFCVQLQRLQLTYVDTGHGAKSKKKSVRFVKAKLS